MEKGTTEVVRRWRRLCDNHTLTKRDLAHIIAIVPPIQGEAISLFLERDPKPSDLANLMRFIKDPQLRSKVWEVLKMDPACRDELGTIIHYAPEFADEAGEIILQGDCTNEQLLAVFMGVFSLKEASWQRLLEQGPSTYNLIEVLCEGQGEYSKESERMLRQRRLDRDELERVLGCLLGRSKKRARDFLETQKLSEETVKEALVEMMIGGNQEEKYGLVEWAAKELLRWGPTNDELCYILTFGIFSSKEWERAAAMLPEHQPENHHLLKIIEMGTYISNLTKGAINLLLQQEPTNEELGQALWWLSTNSHGSHHNDEAIEGTLERLMASNPSVRELTRLVDILPKLEPEIRNRLSNQELTSKELLEIWMSFPPRSDSPLREEVWRLFLGRPPTAGQLIEVIKSQPSRAHEDETWEVLIQQEPDSHHFTQLIEAKHLPADLISRAQEALDLYWARYHIIEEMSALCN